MIQNHQIRGDKQQDPWEGLGDTGMLHRVIESSRAGGREVLSPKYQTQYLRVTPTSSCHAEKVEKKQEKCFHSWQLNRDNTCFCLLQTQQNPASITCSCTRRAHADTQKSMHIDP